MFFRIWLVISAVWVFHIWDRGGGIDDIDVYCRIPLIFGAMFLLPYFVMFGFGRVTGSIARHLTK